MVSTKAPERARRPDEPPRVPQTHLWILPDCIAYWKGGAQSLLGFTTCAAALCRAVAETSASGKKVTKRIAEATACELFAEAAKEIVAKNEAQAHKPDVVLLINDGDVDILFAKTIVESELRRAAVFALRSAYLGARSTGFVLSTQEYLPWFIKHVQDTRSKPMENPNG